MGLVDLRAHPEGDCPHCRGLQWVRVDAQPGESGFGDLVPCECASGEFDARRLRRLLEFSGMTRAELDLRLDDLVARGECTPRLVARARRFVERPWGFFAVWGGYGNGKTLVLQAVLNELREGRGWAGAYAKMAALVDYLRAGFADGASSDERARFEELRDAQVLAIDEMDGARMTEYAFEVRSRLIDERYRLALAGEAHTLFAMNRDPADGWLAGDIFDRLRDGRFRPDAGSEVIFCNADASMRPALVPGR